MSERVGRLFPVENSAVNVFGEQPRGDGLSLSTLALQRLSATPDTVLKTRQKIGLGKHYTLCCAFCVFLTSFLFIFVVYL